jgi:hypothetical protein
MVLTDKLARDLAPKAINALPRSYIQVRDLSRFRSRFSPN